MDIKQNFKIIGSGIYFPQQVLDAEQVDHRIGKPAGWTRENIGVLRRHECTDPESIATMAREAVTHAMDDAAIDWSDVDLIIDCSTSRHRPIPCNAVHVQALFGQAARSIPCFDIQSTCLGFIVALNVANSLMQSDNYQNIMIVCSEAPLTGVNWQDPESSSLFGDAAAAVVLSRREASNGGLYIHESFSDYLDACTIDGGGHCLTPYDFTRDNETRYRFRMDGSTVMRAAIKHLRPMVRKVLDRPEVDLSMLHIVPHQGAPKSLDIMRRHLAFPEDRYYNNVAQYGNLVAASIPVTLHQCLKNEKIRAGDRVMLIGTSAGYSQAAMVFDV